MESLGARDWECVGKDRCVSANTHTHTHVHVFHFFLRFFNFFFRVIILITLCQQQMCSLLCDNCLSLLRTLLRAYSYWEKKNHINYEIKVTNLWEQSHNARRKKMTKFQEIKSLIYKKKVWTFWEKKSS